MQIHADTCVCVSLHTELCATVPLCLDRLYIHTKHTMVCMVNEWHARVKMSMSGILNQLCSLSTLCAFVT